MQPTSRPQTLKQAKRAYRKSGATIRLSASEIAQAERRVSLQERADRIKEREARRKANLRKREEKIAREREIARKMGRPFIEEMKGGLGTVGPSQLSLGGFLNGVQQIVVGYPQVEEVKENLQPVIRPGQGELPGDQETTSPPTQSIAKPARNFACPPLEERSPKSSALRMPPPPKPQPRQHELADGTFDDYFPSNTQVERELSPSPHIPKPVPEARTSQYFPQPHYPTPLILAEEEADDVLAGISTQDLDFSGAFTQAPVPTLGDEEEDILAQISTQDLDFEDEPVKAAAIPTDLGQDALLAQFSTQDLTFSQDSAKLGFVKAGSEPDFADDPTDNDLEDFALELDVKSSTETTLKAIQESGKQQNSATKVKQWGETNE